MGELFRRVARVTLHKLEISGLRIVFDVGRSLKREPNTAEVRIYNLNGDHRAQLQEQTTVPVRLEAGYEPSKLSSSTDAALAGIGVDAQSTLSQLFTGDLRRAYSTREGPDWVTVIRSGDGEKAGRSQRVQMSFRPGVQWTQIYTDLIKKAGVDVGNALSAITGSATFKMPTAAPVSIMGNALDEIERIGRSHGFETSVQDNALQVLPLGKAALNIPVELSAQTGLIGSPEPASDGHVRFRSLLTGDIVPGRRVELTARSFSGTYRVESVNYTGDTNGGPWYADCEGKPV
jgi:hypothetical protein